MTSVARASAFLRHMPAVYRQLSNKRSVCPSNTQFAVASSLGLAKFRHLTVTCPPARCLQSHGSAHQATESQTRVAHPSYQAFQSPRSPDRDFRVVLKRLDDMVRRTGRITRNQLQAVFDEVSRLGVATPNQSLLLIRSCGSLLPELQPKERTELVHTFWDKMKEFGTKYDASHYNALLKVYLQNEHDFKPTDFLAKMEADDVEPNRVTYQRLISAYCLKGDIPGATQILEFMKTKDLPVTEGVFNSLITGHARANDMENARNTLDMMRNVGLEPSADTFTTLMSAYAEKGDVAEVEKVIEEAESQNVLLSTRHYLSVAYSLAVSGNKDHLPKILERAEIGSGFIPDTINLCLSLMARGLDEAAFETVKLFIDKKEDRRLVEGETFNQGNFFLDHALLNNMPIEKLSPYMDQMIELGLHSCPHTVALHASLRRGDSAYAEKIIRRMKELGFPLKCHYFWPMLANASDKNETKRLLGLMIEMGVPVSVDTYTQYVLPGMQADSTEVVATVQELGGTVDGDLINALCRHELQKDHLRGIHSLLNQYPDMGEVSTFKASLITVFIRSREVEPFVAILKHVCDKFTPSRDNGILLPEYIGTLLYDVIAAIPSENLPAMKPHLQLLFTKMAEEGIYINGLRFRGIRNILGRNRHLGLKDSALKIVDPTELEELSVGNIDLFVREDVESADLERVLKETKEKNANYRSPLISLMLRHCGNNDYDKAMELKQEFDAAGYELTGAIYASMISMCCNLDKVSEALLLYRQTKEFDPGFALDITKYRALITTLAKNNQAEEIWPILDEISNLRIDTDKLEKNLYFLLNDLAKEGLSETVQRIFDHLISNKVVRISNDLVGVLVTSSLHKDDVTGALQSIIDCQNKYKMMPHFHDLLVKLVEKGNTEQLQQAMDFASEHHGDINMLYDLIFAFLSTGKLSEAMKVIETPGMVSRDRRLQWYAEKCVATYNEEALKNLVNITRDLYGCDRDNMYFYLIRYYAKTRDPDQCLQVWTNMQDEGVLPKDRTLRYLANILNTYNKPVPFQVPERVDEPASGDDESSGRRFPGRSEEATIRRGEHPVIVLSKLGKFVEAERQLDQYRDEGQEVPLGVYANLMWEHLKRGNIEECLQYKERCSGFDHFTPNRDFNNRLIIEYTKKGDLENANKVFSESLSAGIAPLASGSRMLAQKYLETKDVEKILELKEVYESSTNRYFPATKFVLAAFIERHDVSGALSFIGGELVKHPDRSRRVGIRSFYSKLIQRNEVTQQVTDFAEQHLANDVADPILALLFAYLDNDKVEEAKALMEKCPALEERSSAVLGYLIDMVGRDDNVRQRIENVLSMTEGQTYLDREKVYFYLLKACDLLNDPSDGLRVKERMEAEGIQLTDFNLKRLGLLLERNGQQVPFTMPPESLTFYREKLQSEQKDHLPEIVTE